jgi:hypothetical protein
MTSLDADFINLAGRLDGIFVGVWVPSILALGSFLLTHRAPPR